MLGLFLNVHLAVTLFRRPAVDGTEGGRMKGLTGAQTKAGMMPWTGDRLAVSVALGQRAIVMGAGADDGKDLFAQANENHGIVADMASEDLSVFEFFDGEALRQVGS